MKSLKCWLFAGAALFSVASSAEQGSSARLVLFTNVMVFDGLAEELIKADVLVEGNLIRQVSSEPLVITASANSTIIDGGGRTLMPGLIDSHTHLYATGVFQSFAGLQASKWDQIGAMANENACKNA